MADISSQGAIIGTGFPPGFAPSAPHFRRWKTRRFVEAVDPPPTDALAPVASFVDIKGGSRIKLMITHPDLTVDGLIPNVSNYSFQIWGEGGEEAYYPLGNPTKVDERAWSPANRTDYIDQGGKPFLEDFFFEGVSRIYVQIYALTLTDPITPGLNTGVYAYVRVL